MKDVLWTPTIVEMTLGQMNDHLDMMEQHISESEKRLENEFEQFVQSYGASEAEYALSDEIGTVQQYPLFLYSSFVVMWYSFIEQSLFDLCFELDRESWNKEREKGYPRLDDARRFFTEKGFQVGKNKNWQELTNIRKLRNILVHRGNKIWITHRKPDDDFLCLSEIKEDIPGLREWIEEMEQMNRELESLDGMVSEADNRDTLEWYIRKKDVEDNGLYQYMKKHKLLTCEGNFLTILPGIKYCRHLVAYGHDLVQEILS